MLTLSLLPENGIKGVFLELEAAKSDLYRVSVQWISSTHVWVSRKSGSCQGHVSRLPPLYLPSWSVYNLIIYELLSP